MFTIPAPPPKVKRRADIFAARTMLPPRRAGDFFIGCKYAHNVVYYMQNCARRARKRSLCTGKNKRQGRKTHGRQTLYRPSCPLPLPPARRRGRCFCRRAPPARSARPPRDRVRAQQRNAGPGPPSCCCRFAQCSAEDLPRSARAAAPRACRHRTCTQHTVCGQPCGVLGRAPAPGSRRCRRCTTSACSARPACFCAAGRCARTARCAAAGLLNAVRHACYRGSRAQSAVCAFVYAFHRLLGTYRHVSLIALTGFDRDKLLAFNARRPVLIRSIFF